MSTHILDGGLALCGFTLNVPALWPQGHNWTAAPSNATCSLCLVMAAKGLVVEVDEPDSEEHLRGLLAEARTALAAARSALAAELELKQRIAALLRKVVDSYPQRALEEALELLAQNPEGK